MGWGALAQHPFSEGNGGPLPQAHADYQLRPSPLAPTLVLWCVLLRHAGSFSSSVVLLSPQESIVGNCMDRSSPGQAMQVPDHNGLGYPARPASSEHPRPRTLQRHHTIQNSDDAYVGLGAARSFPGTRGPRTGHRSGRERPAPWGCWP